MPQYPQIGKVSSVSVHKGTGKDWDQWIAILSKEGAQLWTHQEIVAFLKKKYKLGPWWQQGVTLGYEIAIGRRVEGQNAKGEYMLTVTKSLAVDVKKTWKVLESEEGQKLWLRPLYAISVEAGAPFETEDGYFGEIRTLKKDRRIRLTWQDPNWEKKTVVQVILVPRAGGSSILCFNHEQISDAKTQAQLRKRWQSAVSELAEKLAEQKPKSKSRPKKRV